VTAQEPPVLYVAEWGVKASSSEPVKAMGYEETFPQEKQDV
jgi:hypothetical protein